MSYLFYSIVILLTTATIVDSDYSINIRLRFNLINKIIENNSCYTLIDKNVQFIFIEVTIICLKLKYIITYVLRDETVKLY